MQMRILFSILEDPGNIDLPALHSNIINLKKNITDKTSACSFVKGTYSI